MGSQQKFRSMRQPYVRACAVAQVQKQNQHKITLMVAYAIASAIIVLWMAYWPTLTSSILNNIVPTHLSSASDSVNRANKGDQLTSVPFNDRWNVFATMPIQTLGKNGLNARATDLTKDIQPIPVGCEPAFSRLVKTGNFSARCIASANIPARLA